MKWLFSPSTKLNRADIAAVTCFTSLWLSNAVPWWILAPSIVVWCLISVLVERHLFGR